MYNMYNDNSNDHNKKNISNNNINDNISNNQINNNNTSDCNGNQTHNHSVYKRTLNHSFTIPLETNWLWVRVLVAVTETSDITYVLSMEFLDIQETIESGFTLKLEHEMIRTNSQ